MVRAMWRIDGSTVYVLNKNGENLLSFHVQPGKVSNGERVPETFCQSVAENII